MMMFFPGEPLGAVGVCIQMASPWPTSMKLIRRYCSPRGCPLADVATRSRIDAIIQRNRGARISICHLPNFSVSGPRSAKNHRCADQLAERAAAKSARDGEHSRAYIPDLKTTVQFAVGLSRANPNTCHESHLNEKSRKFARMSMLATTDRTAV